MYDIKYFHDQSGEELIFTEENPLQIMGFEYRESEKITKEMYEDGLRVFMEDVLECRDMDGQLQVNYPRKNWSSLILWNCNHPSNKNLNVETVNKLSPQELHRFTWLKDDEIGELPLEWNWLVGWYKEGNPKALHYTEGGPWFENYRDCEYSEIWKKYFGEMSNV